MLYISEDVPGESPVDRPRRLEIVGDTPPLPPSPHDVDRSFDSTRSVRPRRAILSFCLTAIESRLARFEFARGNVAKSDVEETNFAENSRKLTLSIFQRAHLANAWLNKVSYKREKQVDREPRELRGNSYLQYNYRRNYN